MARLDISSEQLQNYIQRVRELKTPPELRATRRIAPKAPVDVASISNKNPIQPQELKLHPETPTIDNFPSTIEQSASNFSVLMTLFPQAKKLVQQAIEEQKLLGVVA